MRAIRTASILFLLAMISITFGFSSLGRDFFFCYPANAQRAGIVEPAAFYDGQVILTSSYPTTGTITNSTGSFTVGFTIAADDIRTITIDSTHWITSTETVEDKGLRIQTDNDVTAYFLAFREPGATNDMALLFPNLSLGNEYIVMCWRDNAQSVSFTFSDLGPSMVAIVGTVDGTVVTITPTVDTEGGHSAGVPFSVTLDQYETYQVLATTDITLVWPPTSTVADLTGTIVESTHPVSVYGGSAIAYVVDEVQAGDYLLEQMPPLISWGTEFVAFPVQPRQGWDEDVLRILASEDATNIAITDDGGTTNIVLNRGEYYDWDGPCVQGSYIMLFGVDPSCSGPTLDSPTHIQSDKPILLGQYIMGAAMTQGDCDFLGSPEYETTLGDPAFMLIPPVEQYASRYVFLTPTGYNNDFLNVATETGGEASITLDGAAPTYSTPWFNVPASTIRGARIELEPGSHIIEGDEPFLVQMYAYDTTYASYATVAGQNLLHINAMFEATKYCLETPVPTGTSTTYRIVIRQVGGDPASGIVVSDTLPTGFSFGSSPPTVTFFGSAFASTTVNPSAGDTELTFGRFGMLEGDSIGIIFEVDIAAGVSGIFDNGITISDVDDNTFSTVGGTIGTEDDCEVTLCDAMPAFIHCPFPCGEFTSCEDQSIQYIIADTTGTTIDTTKIYFSLDWGSGTTYLSEGTHPSNIASYCFTPSCDSILVTIYGFMFPDGSSVTFSLDSAYAVDSCKTVY